MPSESIWIVGSSRSGKTTCLVEKFCSWMQMEFNQTGGGKSSFRRRRVVQSAALAPVKVKQTASGVLVFAANGDNRIELADRIATATKGKYPVQTTTPLGFFQDEVMLFWPLLIQRLNLRAQFPVRLRPETEQELATQLWRSELDQGIWQLSGVNEYRFVRRALDLLLLAGASGTPSEDLESLLDRGVVEDVTAGLPLFASREEEAAEDGTPLFPVNGEGGKGVTFNWGQLGGLLQRWRNWCWERGFLTYGIIYELYWRYLLNEPIYQQYLRRRYQWVLADDVDDYPAIARHLFNTLLSLGIVGAFTFNPAGGIRLGLGADPDYMQGLAAQCQVETLTEMDRPVPCLDDRLGLSIVELITDLSYLSTLPESIQTIQTISRAQLLRQTAEAIAAAVHSGQVQPQDIAIIAPGLDAIARYTLVEILTSKGIPVESLKDQRPLSSSPLIRALLTLLAFIYPGIGRLVDRDGVAEMLLVLSTRYEARGTEEPDSSESVLPSTQPLTPETVLSQESPLPSEDYPLAEASYSTPLRGGKLQHSKLITDIDPVRAGLLADYCFAPHPEQPNLLPVKVFARWDRLGHRATKAYEGIVKWVEEQRSQQAQHLIPSPVHLLDRAIQHFCWNNSYLPFDQLAAVRELLETAQHYWEVDDRLRKSDLTETPSQTTVGRFIQMLRRGTVTANPYPVRSVGPGSHAVTLATIFQYRSSRKFHQWQFWLDAGSPLWSKGGAATLFGAMLFLQARFGRLWSAEAEFQADEARLRRILRDLLSRTGERVYLCHSDLAVNGQEQTGSLLSLVNAAVPVNAEATAI